jgi:beta-lactamase class A
MRFFLQRLVPVLLLVSAAGAGHGASPVGSTPALQRLVDQSITAAVQKYARATNSLLSNQIAVTLIDLRDATRPQQASYRGSVRIYPASVIKLFYLAAAHRWMEDGRLIDTPELRRALRDMIVDSSNDATHYVIDLLTDTTSGPELPDRALDDWFEKRNAVNRYFTSLGYANVVANKKPWCEGPYGREAQSIKRQQPNRNMLSTDDTARLLLEIISGQCVTAARSSEMRALLQRDPFKRIEDGGEPDQGNAFVGLALRDRPGAKLWSKAGWTSQVRHDAAYVELPQGGRFLLVIFTEGHSQERGVLEAIGRTVVDEFSRNEQ